MDKYTVFSADGTVCVGSSVAAYRAALEAWVDENEVQAEQLRKACHAVFVQAGEMKLPLAHLVSAVLCILKPSVQELPEVQARVEKFVKANTGSEESSCLYCASAGRGGGYYRNPRLVAMAKETAPEATDDATEE